MNSLQELFENRDVEAIRAFMAENRLVLDGKRLIPADDDAAKKLKALSAFWNQRQQARKILLNSLYGALLNEGLRFYDERLGQSVTLTGRSIVRHMNAKTNEVITGKYDYTGDAIVYADTDSCYFSAYEILKNDPAYSDFGWDRSDIVKLYDDISGVVNDSFPEFMHKTFNTSIDRGAIIVAGRELVAGSSLFIKKKKYAVLMYEKEGDRLDIDGKPGKLKAMGLDLKRADTPKFMQKFLEQVLMDVLTDVSKPEIMKEITEFREAFKSRPAAEKGSPKKAGGMTTYGDKLKATEVKSIYDAAEGKTNMPGHVRASMNWNNMCVANDDKYSMRITDGTRIVVCKLKPNVMRIDSIAYPIDEPHLPQWFKDLPFDHEAMEETIIDNKLDNLLGVLDWNFVETKKRPGDEFFDFSRKKRD